MSALSCTPHLWGQFPESFNFLFWKLGFSGRCFPSHFTYHFQVWEHKVKYRTAWLWFSLSRTSRSPARWGLKAGQKRRALEGWSLGLRGNSGRFLYRWEMSESYYSTPAGVGPGILSMGKPALGRGWERNPGPWPSGLTILRCWNHGSGENRDRQHPESLFP